MTGLPPPSDSPFLTPARLPSIAAVLDRRSLEPVLGPITSLSTEPLGAAGFSGSQHQRVLVELATGRRLRFMFKHVALAQVWTAYRTGDSHGREASLLADRELDEIWRIFRNPYVAYAAEDGEIALLMDDLSECLLPDLNEPLTLAQEDAILTAIASMHARFWQSAALDHLWLNSPARLFAVLGPKAAREELTRKRPHPLFELVGRGWEFVLAELPSDLCELVQRPPADLASVCATLPRTLLHGDAKIANFALLNDGGVSAFDWAGVGAGPCMLDLGYYLAINSSRLARPKEEVIARYRSLLEAALQERLMDKLWDRLVRAGVLCGVMTLLWEKALGKASGEASAVSEWNWWLDSLRATV